MCRSGDWAPAHYLAVLEALVDCLASRLGHGARRYFVGPRQVAVPILVEELFERAVGLHIVQDLFDGMSDLGIAERQRFDVRLIAAQSDPEEIGTFVTIVNGLLSTNEHTIHLARHKRLQHIGVGIECPNIDSGLSSLYQVLAGSFCDLIVNCAELGAEALSREIFRAFDVVGILLRYENGHCGSTIGYHEYLAGAIRGVVHEGVDHIHAAFLRERNHCRELCGMQFLLDAQAFGNRTDKYRVQANVAARVIFVSPRQQRRIDRGYQVSLSRQRWM